MASANRLHESTMPQQTRIVELTLLAAEKDPNLIASLVTNAGQVFASAGYPLQPAEYSAFNLYVRDQLDSVLKHLTKGGKLTELQGVGCTLCQIGCYTIAVGIVAVGAAGLAFLTPEAAIVTALAAYAGVGAAATFSFIVGLGTAIGGGVAVVASNICQWTGACSS